MFSIIFKPEVKPQNTSGLTANCLIIFEAVAKWFKEKDLPLIITSMQEHVPGRKSRTHQEGRAFDVSVRPLTTDLIDELIIDFNRDYKKYGAISIKDYEQRVVIYHQIEGGEPHLHFQTRS